MVRAGCVFVAGIHPSRTWTSGSFESVRWNACVHRLDLGLYSHPKEFGGNGVWTHVNSKGKIPSTGKCPQRSIEPATLWQPAQALPTELFRPQSGTKFGRSQWSLLAPQVWKHGVEKLADDVQCYSFCHARQPTGQMDEHNWWHWSICSSHGSKTGTLEATLPNAQ